ncbi:T6SS immunity protein Tdi1 domain-containing protein [Nonomuraea sp. NPDC001831]|uniref:T6SS immunity protein Tdi1 domain-containing protein n=1 Tax=Nonomuraea sp. NPDC001831 TaxID=3364340 RepID=UPI0036B73697
MLDRFLQAYELTANVGTDGGVPRDEGRHAAADRLLSGYGGSTFNDGLYRIHTWKSRAEADAFAAHAFPEFGNLSCFGFDWLGRQFSLDLRVETEDPPILMLEPGTGQALEIPVPFSDFHNGELVDYADEALAKSFYQEWRTADATPLGFGECVGYNVPLFLGGEDHLVNLSRFDIEIYWHIIGELRQGTSKLAPGTRIDDITITDEVRRS